MFVFFYFLQFTCPAASWRHNLLLWHTLASGGKKGISYESLNQLINSYSTKLTKILRWELPGAFTSYRHSLLVFLPARRRESILRCVTCFLVVVISTICVVCVQLEGRAKKGKKDEALNKSHNNTEGNLLLSLNLSHWQRSSVDAAVDLRKRRRHDERVVLRKAHRQWLREGGKIMGMRCERGDSIAFFIPMIFHFITNPFHSTFHEILALLRKSNVACSLLRRKNSSKGRENETKCIHALRILYLFPRLNSSANLLDNYEYFGKTPRFQVLEFGSPVLDTIPL